MGTIPSIEDAARIIDEQCREGGRTSRDIIDVIDVVACYSAADGIEIFAVVDGLGGVSYPLGDDMPSMMTVRRRLEAVQEMEGVWVGESVAVGNDRILIVGRGGYALPGLCACRQALDGCDALNEFGTDIRATIGDISGRLRLAEQKLAATLVLLVQFDELAEAVARTSRGLAAVGELWQCLDRLAALPTARRIDVLDGDIASEKAAMRDLTTLVDATLTTLDQSLVRYRAEFEVLDEQRRAASDYLQSERQRVSAEYCDALIDPQPIDDTDAEREFEEISRTGSMDGHDADTLKRRMLTLRLRIKKTIEDGGRMSHLDSLLDGIDKTLGKATDDENDNRPISRSRKKGNQLSLDI